MKSPFLSVARVAGFIFTLYLWRAVQLGQFSQLESLGIIIGGILLIFPTVWIGRKVLDIQPTIERLVWVTTVVHMVLMILFGVSIIEAISFFYESPGVRIPIPAEVGIVLLCATGVCSLLTVVNLAIDGLGAPFAIALSKRLANRWMYKWTRNPMVLCTMATLFSAGVYLQSLYFILWVALVLTPAWIYYLRAYEERELEIRFGASYLEYKAKTSFLVPRKPKN